MDPPPLAVQSNLAVDETGKDPMLPSIISKRDLTSLSEVFDYETGAFLRSTFSFIDDRDTAWFGQAPGVRKYDLTVKDLQQHLHRIPDETIYPLHKWTTVVPEADRKGCFIKRPKISCVDNPHELELVPQMLSEEAEVLELLRQHEHPNIVRYHGCTVRRGRITGLVLERYEVILQYRHEDVPGDLDIAACMNGIRAGVKHLHDLGLAHNDLNPTNIALDSHDEPILLDFGSCKKFGEQLLSGGTLGWIEDDYSISAQRNDEAALEMIQTWLQSKDKGKVA